MVKWIEAVLATGVFAAVQIAAAEGSQRPPEEMRIEREVAAACREIDAHQAKLSDRCSLVDYRALVRAVNGTATSPSWADVGRTAARGARVGRVVLENVRTRGVPPKVLVYASSFDDINKDGRSTGRCVIEKIERPVSHIDM